MIKTSKRLYFWWFATIINLPFLTVWERRHTCFWFGSLIVWWTQKNVALVCCVSQNGHLQTMKENSMRSAVGCRCRRSAAALVLLEREDKSFFHNKEQGVICLGFLLVLVLKLYLEFWNETQLKHEVQVAVCSQMLIRVVNLHIFKEQMKLINVSKRENKNFRLGQGLCGRGRVLGCFHT